MKQAIFVVAALLSFGCGGELGPVGPVGPMGPEGPSGPEGPAGPGSAEYYSYGSMLTVAPGEGWTDVRHAKVTFQGGTTVRMFATGVLIATNLTERDRGYCAIRMIVDGDPLTQPDAMESPSALDFRTIMVFREDRLRGDSEDTHTAQLQLKNMMVDPGWGDCELTFPRIGVTVR